MKTATATKSVKPVTATEFAEFANSLKTLKNGQLIDATLSWRETPIPECCLKNCLIRAEQLRREKGPRQFLADLVKRKSVTVDQLLAQIAERAAIHWAAQHALRANARQDFKSLGFTDREVDVVVGRFGVTN